MTLNKLAMRVDADGYNIQFNTALRITQLDGGAPRTRIDILNGWMPVTVQWTTGQVGYNYLKQTYRYCEVNGGAHFLIDLVVEHSFVVETEAMYQPASFELVEQSGLVYVVRAGLFIKPTIGEDSTWPTEGDYQSALLQEDGGYILL